MAAQLSKVDNLLSLVGDGSYQEPRNYEAVDLPALLNHRFPVRDHVLAPVFTLGSLGMVYAWRGVGKTHVALGIAYAAASGGTFFGWQAARAFRVLYLDGEMPGETLQERLASIVASSDAEPPAGYFRTLTIDLCGGVMPDLATQEGQEAIAEECELAELIIVDNLSCLVRGNGRENDAESWLLAASWALSMRSKGKCVVFVHHAGKDGAQRGTSKREDLLDVSISLKRPTDYEPDQGARFVVEFQKARHLTGADSAPFEAQLGTDEHGRRAWMTKPLSIATYERVIELAALGLNQRDIADELGIDKSRVSRHMRRAREEGRLPTESGSKPKAKRRADVDD